MKATGVASGMKLVLFGEPGAGKGTLAEMLSHRRGVAHISTGDLFRREMKLGTSLGKSVEKFMNAGYLVPDPIVLDVVSELFKSKDFAKGFALDGFPRTVPQARAFDALLREMSWELEGIIKIDVQREELVKRLSSRRTCKECGAIYNIYSYPPREDGRCRKCGGEVYQREDDKEEVVRERLRVYEEQIAAVIDHYRRKGALKTIDTTGLTADESYAELMKALGQKVIK